MSECSEGATVRGISLSVLIVLMRGGVVSTLFAGASCETYNDSGCSARCNQAALTVAAVALKHSHAASQLTTGRVSSVKFAAGKPGCKRSREAQRYVSIS